MASYILRDIPADLRARWRARAEAQSLPMRTVLLALIEMYAEGRVDVSSTVTATRFPALPLPLAFQPDPITRPTAPLWAILFRYPHFTHLGLPSFGLPPLCVFSALSLPFHEPTFGIPRPRISACVGMPPNPGASSVM